MSLIKTRPKLRLLLERRLVAGELAAFVVEIDCPKPLPVAKISFALFGHVVWFTTSQYGRHRHSSRFLSHAVALADAPAELPAGVHRLRTRLRLGDELPGSWEGDRLAIEYSVVVHVDIPWWPDAHVEFTVEVAPASAPPAVQAGAGAESTQDAVVYASHVDGPPAKSPYLELSIGRHTLRAGAPMQLSAALGNVERNRYRKLDVAILAQEAFPTGLGGQYVHEHVVGRWSVGLDNHPGELQPIPFNLALPAGLSPAFELHGCSLRWLLQVEADVAWGVNPKLRFPVEVEARAPLPAGDGELPAPLAVGSDRLRLIWSAVAKQTGLELRGGSSSLHWARGPVTVEVHRSQHEGQARVVGLLEFPSLAVGLHTERARRGLLGGATLGLAARDPEQTRVLGLALASKLAAGPGELLAADDTSLRFALPGTGLEHDGLLRFVASLVELAPAITAVAAELPAPAVVAAHVEAWRAAATKLGARLRLADLQLELTREGQTLRITTTYADDGTPRSTLVELAPGVSVPARHHLLWTGDFALPPSELPLVELATPPSWADEARVALEITTEGVRLYLPAPLPDPLLERPRLDALLAVGRVLRGELGPYR